MRTSAQSEAELQQIATAIVGRSSSGEDSGLEDSPASLVLREARALIDKVSAGTGWQVDQLLQKLGCRMRGSERFAELNVAQVERCRNYFAWVERLTVMVDRASERRRVVAEAARLYRAADFDLRIASRSMSGGPFPATAYLELGEIDGAFAHAMARAERKPLPEATVHLRPKRIDRYLDSGDTSISPWMREKIAVHLVTCKRCSEAVRLRRTRKERMTL